MAKLLMCPPTHFGVTYDINPWMSHNVGAATPGVPDLVFTANAALMCDRTAIVSTFGFPQRLHALGFATRLRAKRVFRRRRRCAVRLAQRSRCNGAHPRALRRARAAATIARSAGKPLRHRLETIGYRVCETDLSEFQKAGGSAKCLTLKLDDAPVRRIEPRRVIPDMKPA
jgi:N-dimethylarginine dimethylaminohydrolase